MEDLQFVWHNIDLVSPLVPPFGVPTFIAVALQMPTYDNLDLSLPVVRLHGFGFFDFNTTLPAFDVTSLVKTTFHLPIVTMPDFDLHTIDLKFGLGIPSFPVFSLDPNFQRLLLSSTACVAISVR